MCIELAPPPVAAWKAAAGSKKLPKGGGAVRSSSKEKEGVARGVRGTADEDLEGVGRGDLGEKVQHGDYGGGDSNEGRWRACLAESGKVGG